MMRVYTSVIPIAKYFKLANKPCCQWSTLVHPRGADGVFLCDVTRVATSPLMACPEQHGSTAQHGPTRLGPCLGLGNAYTMVHVCPHRMVYCTR